MSGRKWKVGSAKVSREQAALLLDEALEMIAEGRPLEGLAGAYASQVLLGLKARCQSNSKRPFQNIAGDVLAIARGRQAKDIGPLEIDNLTLVLTVHGLKRSGLGTGDAIEATAARYMIDRDEVRKRYYRHWDGQTYWPAGRQK